MKELIYSFPIVLLVLFFACGENTQQNNVNYKIYHNNRYDYTVEYPDFLIPQGEGGSQDGQKFISEDQKIELLVYCEYKLDFNSEGEFLPIDKAYEEDLSFKEEVLNKNLDSNHYTIEYKMDDMLHNDYAIVDDNIYYNIRFEYPEKEKDRMKGVLEHIVNTFKMHDFNFNDENYEGDASVGEEIDLFPAFLEDFLNDCYWGKNFNSLLRNNDKILATYIDSKMDVRRYYAPGTITKLGTRDEDFGLTEYDDFIFNPRPTDDLIFEYLNDDGGPCDLIYSNINVIYHEMIESVPDVVVNNETFETIPVDIIYPKAEIMAVYLPNAYNNPVGYYFIYTPNGWKLAFVDDTLCGA